MMNDNFEAREIGHSHKRHPGATVPADSTDIVFSQFWGRKIFSASFNIP